MNKILALFQIIAVAAPASTISSSINSQAEISIKQSVDDDLRVLSNQIELNKYLEFKDEQVYRPIIMYFAESTSDDYYSLLYVYDPLDKFDCINLSYEISCGNNDDYNNYEEYANVSSSLIYAGTSSDNKVDRYALDIYDNQNNRRDNYNYRYYKFNRLAYNKKDSNDNYTHVYNSENEYLFFSKNDLNTMKYATNCNVLLGDARAWSYHFDEDDASTNLFENFKSLFGFKSDTLKDQLFYSFYFKNWDVKDIKSIDMSYKKILLEGNRYNVADETATDTVTWYEGTDESFNPKYYAWNDANTKDNYDKSSLLGSTLEDVIEQVESTHRTINHEITYSLGEEHRYFWDKIQTLDEFKKAFGIDSNIYKFANSLMKEQEHEDYWIINYDDFWYSYSKNNFLCRVKELLTHTEKKDNEDFVNYLNQNGINEQYSSIYSDTLVEGYTIDYYSFAQELTIDVKATSITFTDSGNTTRTLPVSVVPVDGGVSGGTSSGTWTEEEQKRVAIITIVIIIIIVLLVIAWPYIGPFITPILKFFLRVVLDIVKGIGAIFNFMFNALFNNDDERRK